MDVDQIRKDLEYITKARPLPEGEKLGEVLVRLDAAAAGELPERLQHYLSKRSYVKALEWLDQPQTPHYR